MLHSYIDFPKQNVPYIILTIPASQAIVISVFAREDIWGWTDDVWSEAMWVLILTVTLTLTFLLFFETGSHCSPGCPIIMSPGLVLNFQQSSYLSFQEFWDQRCEPPHCILIIFSQTKQNLKAADSELSLCTLSLLKGKNKAQIDMYDLPERAQRLPPGSSGIKKESESLHGVCEKGFASGFRHFKSSLSPAAVQSVSSLKLASLGLQGLEH